MEFASEPSLAASGEACDEFAALRELGLNDGDLAALRRQGYLTRDKSLPGGDGYWRLRFRIGKRKRTVYLGTDLARVEQVRRELTMLRAARMNRRRLAKTVAEGKRALRQVKQRSAPAIAQLGYRYHGDALRKTRRCERLNTNYPLTQTKEMIMNESPVREEETTVSPSTTRQEDPNQEADSLGSAFSQRLKDIQDFRVAKQQKPEMLAGLLKAVTSDLFESELYVAEAYLAEQRAARGSSECDQANSQGPDLLLRFSKQIAQYARLLHQSDNAERLQKAGEEACKAKK